MISALVLLYLIYDEFRGVGDVNTDGWKVFGLGGEDFSKRQEVFGRSKKQRGEKAVRTVQQKYRDTKYRKQYDSAKKALGEKIVNKGKHATPEGDVAVVEFEKNKAGELKKKKAEKRALETKISELKDRNGSFTFPRWWKETEEKEKSRDRWFGGGGGGDPSQSGGGNIIDIPQDSYARAKKGSDDPLYTAVLKRVQYKSGNQTASASEKEKAKTITDDIQKTWTKKEMRDPVTNKKIIRYEEPKKGGNSLFTKILKLIANIPWFLKDMLYTICDFCDMKNPKGVLIILLIEVIIIILYLVLYHLYPHSYTLIR